MIVGPRGAPFAGGSAGRVRFQADPRNGCRVNNRRLAWFLDHSRIVDELDHPSVWSPVDLELNRVRCRYHSVQGDDIIARFGTPSVVTRTLAWFATRAKRYWDAGNASLIRVTVRSTSTWPPSGPTSLLWITAL